MVDGSLYFSEILSDGSICKRDDEIVQIVGQMTVSDVNFFILKAILNLETSHWICLVRTAIVGLAAAPAAAGMHQLIWSSKSRSGDGQAALLVAIIVAELILIIKWAPTGLPNWSVPMPAYSKVTKNTFIFSPFRQCFSY